MTSQSICNTEICRRVLFPKFIWSENLFFFFPSQGNSAPNLCHTSHETPGTAPHTSTQCRKGSLREQNPGIRYSQGKASGPTPNAGHPLTTALLDAQSSPVNFHSQDIQMYAVCVPLTWLSAPTSRWFASHCHVAFLTCFQWMPLTPVSTVLNSLKPGCVLRKSPSTKPS